MRAVPMRRSDSRLGTDSSAIDLQNLSKESFIFDVLVFSVELTLRISHLGAVWFMALFTFCLAASLSASAARAGARPEGADLVRGANDAARTTIGAIREDVDADAIASCGSKSAVVATAATDSVAAS